MHFNKKLSKSGGITLPAALRRELGIDQGEKFSISVQENGSIMLKRTQGSCIFCKSEEELATYHGRLICHSCVDNLTEKVGNTDASNCG